MQPLPALFLSAVLTGIPTFGMAASAMQECLLSRMEIADDDMTIGSLRSRCEQELASRNSGVTNEQSTVIEAIRSDRDVENRKYLVSVHNPNYILPFTRNSELNREPWRQSARTGI